MPGHLGRDPGDCRHAGAHLPGTRVHVDQPRARRQARITAGRERVEHPGAHGEHHVAAFKHRRVLAVQAEVAGVGRGERQVGQVGEVGAHHRRGQQVSHRPQLRGAVAGRAAHDDYRPAGPGQRRRCGGAGRLAGHRPAAGPECGVGHRRHRCLLRHRAAQEILGDGQVAGPSRGGHRHVQRPPHVAAQLRGGQRLVRPLGERPNRLGQVRMCAEAVLGQHGPVLVPGGHHDRRAVAEGVVDLAGTVQRADAGVQADHAGPPGDPGVAVGHRHDRALVQAEHVADARRAAQRLEQRRLGRPGQPEHRVHPGPGEHAGEDLRPVHCAVPFTGSAGLAWCTRPPRNTSAISGLARTSAAGAAMATWPCTST